MQAVAQASQAKGQACSMDCPELKLPSDRNDSLSAGAKVRGTGPGRCDRESSREGGK